MVDAEASAIQALIYKSSANQFPINDTNLPVAVAFADSRYTSFVDLKDKNTNTKTNRWSMAEYDSLYGLEMFQTYLQEVLQHSSLQVMDHRVGTFGRLLQVLT